MILPLFLLISTHICYSKSDIFKGLRTSEYYDSASIPQSGTYAGEFVVRVESLADLKAMDSLPASPIRVTATVTMINDEGGTGTRTVTFETAPSEPSTSGPTAKEIDSIDAPAGTQVDIYLKDVFDNTGTNPRFTGWLIHSVAAANYYRSVQFGWPEAVLDVTVKSAADLATYVALGHSTPLTSKSTVTMTNDEGQTAKATLTLKTTLDPN